MLEETPFINELQTTDSRQALYGVSFRFIIHILVNEEKLGEYPLKTWLLLISTFLENHEELFLKNLLIEKSKVIVNNLCMYASTFLMHPTRNELIPLDSVKMHIVEFIDEIISSSYINDLRSQNGSRQSYLLNN